MIPQNKKENKKKKNKGGYHNKNQDYYYDPNYDNYYYSDDDYYNDDYYDDDGYDEEYNYDDVNDDAVYDEDGNYIGQMSQGKELSNDDKPNKFLEVVDEINKEYNPGDKYINKNRENKLKYVLSSIENEEDISANVYNNFISNHKEKFRINEREYPNSEEDKECQSDSEVKNKFKKYKSKILKNNKINSKNANRNINIIKEKILKLDKYTNWAINNNFSENYEPINIHNNKQNFMILEEDRYILSDADKNESEIEDGPLTDDEMEKTKTHDMNNEHNKKENNNKQQVKDNQKNMLQTRIIDINDPRVDRKLINRNDINLDSYSKIFNESKNIINKIISNQELTNNSINNNYNNKKSNPQPSSYQTIPMNYLPSQPLYIPIPIIIPNSGSNNNQVVDNQSNNNNLDHNINKNTNNNKCSSEDSSSNYSKDKLEDILNQDQLMQINIQKNHGLRNDLNYRGKQYMGSNMMNYKISGLDKINDIWEEDSKKTNYTYQTYFNHTECQYNNHTYYMPSRYEVRDNQLLNLRMCEVFAHINTMYNPTIIHQYKSSDLFSFPIKTKEIKQGDKEKKIDILKYISYSNKINAISRKENTIGVSEKAYNYYKNKGYPQFYQTNSPNDHFDYASFRVGDEDILMRYIQKHYNGFVREAIGDNIKRTEDIGGIYYNHAIDAFDKIKIEKYRNSSCVPNDLKLDQLYDPSTHIANDPCVVTMTDVQYYMNGKFDIAYLFMRNPNENDDNRINTNRRNIKAIYSIFHVYTSKKGVYNYGPLLCKITYNKINYQNGTITIIEKNVSNNTFDQVINIERYTNNNNPREYIIPYVEIIVDNNSYHYYHPFPMINGYIITLEMLNNFSNNDGCISSSILNCSYLTEFDAYITMESTWSEVGNLYLNVAKKMKPIFKLPLKERFPDQNIIRVFKNDIIDLFNIKEYKCLEEGFSKNTYFVEDNYAIIEGNLCELGFINTKYGDELLLARKDIKRCIPVAYLNACINCYRRINLTLDSINSAKNIILKTSEYEKWEPIVDPNTALEYALIAYYIAKKINLKMELNYLEIEKHFEQVSKDARKQIQCQEFKNKVMHIKKTVNNIVENEAVKKTVKYLDKSIYKSVTKPILDSNTWKIINFFMVIYIRFMMFLISISKKVIKWKLTEFVIGKHMQEKLNKKLNIYKKRIQMINYVPDKPVSQVYNKIIDVKNNAFNLNFDKIVDLYCSKPFETIKDTMYKKFAPKNTLSNIYEILVKRKLYNPFKIFAISMISIFLFIIILILLLSAENMIYITRSKAIVLYNEREVFEDMFFKFMHIVNTLWNGLYFIIFLIITNIRTIIKFIYITYLATKNTKIERYQLIVLIIMSFFNGPYYKFASSLINNIARIAITYIINIFILCYIYKHKSPNMYILYLLFLLPKVLGKDVYINSSCSPNDTIMMFEFLTILYKRTNNKLKLTKAENDILKEKYNDRTIGKYKIYKIPEKAEFECDHKAENDTEPLTNIAPQINGYVIDENHPLKIHKCPLDECEAVYRQVQSSIDYDDNIAKEFIKYSQKWIYNMVMEHFSSNNITYMHLYEYFSKLGSKRKEYIDAMNEYIIGTKIDYNYNMHPKSDEKIVINWKKFKAKSRNISAQKSVCKLLMGMVCENAMKILHNQEWAGPGENYAYKAKKFLGWISNLGISCGVLCCDGSAFDSTQHQIFIQQIDSYFLKLVFSECFYLDKYFDLNDVLSTLEQSEFRIYSKYFAFKMLGTQLSGRMNTCLCNTLRSACYVKFIIHKMEEKMHKTLDNIKFEVTGDDQIIFLTYNLKELYVEIAYKYVYYKEDCNIKHGLGQVCKIFDFYPYITGAEYLSCILIYNDSKQKLTLTRKPDRFMQLIPYTFRNNYNNVTRFNTWKKVLCYEVGLGVVKSCSNISLYRRIGEKMMSLGIPLSQKVKDIMHAKRYKNMLIKLEKVRKNFEYKMFSEEDNFDEEFNQYLFDTYDITQEDINELLYKFESCTDVNDDIQCQFIDKLYNITPKLYNEVYYLTNKSGEYVERRIDKNNNYINIVHTKYKFVTK